MQTMYPYAEVFYKTDDTPGWNAAILSGDEECVRQKASKRWKNYKIFSGNLSADEITDAYSAELDPQDVHMTSPWIYSKEVDKWFFPEEIIPLPESKCNTSNSFNINYKISDVRNELDDLVEFYLESLAEKCDEVFVTFDLTVKIDNKSLDIYLQYSDKVEENMRNFLSTVKTDNYAHFIFEEYDYIKILLWNYNGKCRVKFQEYDYHDEVKEPLDFECSTNLFISSFETFLDRISSQYNEICKNVRKEANKKKFVH